MQQNFFYEKFLTGVTRRQWQRLGLRRRAGVCAPLFSLYSSRSAGIGEFPDLELLADWCVKTQMSIIQLLPLNDTAFRFTPYDAASTFALEPMYLRLEKIAGSGLRAAFACGRPRVDYGIKKAKLELLWQIFQSVKSLPEDFQKYMEENIFWLEDYAIYKVIKEQSAEASWESWDEKLKKKEPEAVYSFAAAHSRRILFHQWVQWQVFLQAKEAKRACAAKNVFLMGDLPFLVSRDSADVWAHQDYFKLDRASGAPPDAFFADGQRWGMPPYNWEKIEEHGHDYLIQKVRYAQNFYDLFRIDHVIGTFRLWTLRRDEPEEHAGLHGTFDPEKEALWEGHGKKILSVMIQAADMLPCAEDLGVVPPCSYKVLEEFSIPGMEVQRWAKEWGTTFDFKSPELYRKNSTVVLSNHDTTSLRGWWEFEAGTVDEALFKRKCSGHGIDYEKVKERLFDFSRSAHGRARWKQDLSDISTLASRLERPAQEIAALTALYQESYQEKEKFLRYLGLPAGDYSGKDFPVLLEAALRKVAGAASIFSIQLLQEWLSMKSGLSEDPWEFRINFPGTSGPHNWSLVMPWPLEKILRWKGNEKIREIHKTAGRI